MPTSKVTIYLIVSALLCLFGFSQLAQAASNDLTSASNRVSTTNVTAQFISEYRRVTPGATFGLILQLDIRKDWHTYWRNPGDSGQATSIKWQLPKGISASDIQWPFPERQYIGPVANYGYHGVANHLVMITVSNDWPVSKPVNITAKATWLVCKEECIPESGMLSLVLPSSEKNELADQYSSTFLGVRQQLPTSVDLLSHYQYQADKQIQFEFTLPEKITKSDRIEYFPYDWGVVKAPAPQAPVVESNRILLTTEKGDLKFSSPLNGTVVVTRENQPTLAYEIESSLGVFSENTTGEFKVNTQNDLDSFSFLGALIFALIGGVILNLMPCVFPVLSMKALSLVSHSGESSVVIKRHGMVYTLGILICFVVLGIALIAIKSAGQQIGWGFQLQSPVFVSAIIMVLFILGLSLSGYLEIGTSLMGTGSGLADKGGYSGSFFTGVLAVVVATPCTAPFMGPAMGYALTQPPWIMFAVLLTLGLGLALPYLLLCFFPLLSRKLPRPGLWMQKFQQFLAFPMFATAAWLVWVLGQQTDMNRIFVLLVSLVAVVFTIWVYKNTRQSRGVWAWIINVSCLLLILLLLGVNSSGNSVNEGSVKTASNSLNAEEFGTPVLMDLLQQGKPVFVNMTAAWCITCLANEKVALSSPQLNAYFKAKGITYLKGDWTQQDANISQYLELFGRSSVPLYVYYPAQQNTDSPDMRSARVLPQLLTVAAVIDSIESASPATLFLTTSK